MIIVNTHEAKTQLSQLLNKVETKQEVVRICRNNHPIADLVPIKQVIDPLKQHDELKKVTLYYDPTEPLTDDEWPKE